MRIIEPAGGVRVAANQPLDITVATDTTTTSFLMSVAGRRHVQGPASDQSADAGPSPDTRREGTYTVQVVAFNSSAPANPPP